VQLADALDVGGEVRLDHAGEHRRSVLLALPVAHHDLVSGEVDVLHPQPAALEEAQARSVEQGCHDPRDAVHAREQVPHLVAREDHGQAGWSLRADEAVEPREVAAEDLAKEEEERRERLVLGRGGDATARRRVAQEGRHVLGSEVGGVPAAVELVEADHPSNVGLLRVPAQETQTHHAPRAIAQAGRLAASGKGTAPRSVRGPLADERHAPEAQFRPPSR
jgi:hypothetical protein